MTAATLIVCEHVSHRKDRTTTRARHEGALAAAIPELGIVRTGQREVSDDTAQVVRSDIQRRVARA